MVSNTCLNKSNVLAITNIIERAVRCCASLAHHSSEARLVTHRTFHQECQQRAYLALRPALLAPGKAGGGALSEGG